ncbi:TPA: hypothetical protein L3915_003141 [Pseudomonas aeruginosa]|uniref:hypothetical protein n=2 Tax=Pseudomonas aeruginosa TaxID=287 RepID=UPI000A4DB284|nr:hypothetical protein [Pseudomonas aeruginosa]MBI8816077.1 hypothetical protein [Pseudomonas aeruginosa]MDK0990185.1 hypothetical protein [Pseudomonas aeruginosa]QNQ06775.1 hypothetical protein EBO27_12960 [Pseudomonas aeruginosa]HBN9684274.1 hypothetical protein [Pseudomonas aeruginosa]HBO4953932.1 hypothetical protein [Pseudomonas aeruginosa]
MTEASAACITVGDRQVHDEHIGPEGPEIDQTYFYNNLRNYGNGAVFFELWSYIPGRMPAGFTPDPKVNNASYDIAQIVDGRGNPKELIQISHVLIFGNVVIVEASKGTGGSFLIQKYINKLLRAKCAPRPPTVMLTTAISSDLDKEIEQGGGAVSVSLGISAAQEQNENRVAGLLSRAHSVFSKTGLVALSWTAEKDSVLDTEEVVEEACTAKDDEFDRIFIKLKHGSIKGLSRYKISMPITVRDAGGRNPDHAEIRESMIHYLGLLMAPDKKGNRVIDDEGNMIGNG